MKKMKALLSALSLAVAALTPITSSADFTNGDTMEVSKKYESSYTITIPDGTQELAQGQEFEVGATVFLNYGEKLTVSVASKNGWNLVDKVHNENTDKVSYKMSINNTNITGTTADILEVPYNAEGKAGTVTLTVAELGNATYAGTYSDTLTFTAKTESVSGETESGGESGGTT